MPTRGEYARKDAGKKEQQSKDYLPRLHSFKDQIPVHTRYSAMDVRMSENKLGQHAKYEMANIW